MTNKKGNLSINSENLFPIIKKWLYSDQDIFVREMISNATDAITKLRKLSLIGEYNAPADEKYKITVEISPNKKTLSFTDNGLGMTADEVEEYINQVAFSGAKDFIEKYKDKANDDQIIGHFGLGFYSAFMVADKVTIDTLSYKEGSEAVHWESDGNGEFEMTSSDRTGHGTTITLFLNDNCYEYCNEYRVREVLEKYCSFMPEEIYLVNADEAARKAAEAISKAAEAAKAADAKTAESTDKAADKADAKEGEEAKSAEPKPVNDTHPLWTKTPSECKEDEYKEFYRKVFHDYREPLFWIHLNMDYPFNLKGILYFPKVNLEYETLEGKIKLYNNQVFIADNIKEVIPEFLMLLKGVIDCPDLPLNVSRSALQNDGFVKKIQDYINKKVADKLVGMCKTDRENYEKCWDDISPFIKYGYLKDEKFGEKMFDYILYKDLNGKYLTFKDLVPEDEKATATDDKGNAVEAEVVSDDTGDTAEDKKEKTKVYYVSDEREQSQFMNRFKDEDKTAVLLTHNIDMPYVQKVEMAKDNVSFVRIDTEIDSEELGDDDKKKFDKLGDKVKKYIGNDKLKVEIKELKDAETASMITTSEESLRMQEMMKQYGMMGMNMGDMGMTEQTLVLNAKHPLVQYLLDHKKSAMTEKVAKQLYDMALVSNNQLAPDRIPEFIKRTSEIMIEITK